MKPRSMEEKIGYRLFLTQAFHRHKPDFRSCFYNFPEGYLHTDHDSVLSIHL